MGVFILWKTAILRILIGTFLFNYTWSENFFCPQTSLLQLPPSASCIRHSDQRATCLGSRSVSLCGTGTWPGWRRWRLRSEHTTQYATAEALMFKDPVGSAELQEMEMMVWCCGLFSIFPDARGAPGTSVTFAACLFLVFFCFVSDGLRAVRQLFAPYKWLPVTL